GAVGRDGAGHGEAGAVSSGGRAVVVHGVAEGVPGRCPRAQAGGPLDVPAVVDCVALIEGVGAGEGAILAVTLRLTLVDVLGRDGSGGEGDGGDAGEKSDDFHD